MPYYIVGSFMECVKLCEGKPLKLLDIIMNEFESYQDKPIYEREKGNYC